MRLKLHFIKKLICGSLMRKLTMTLTIGIDVNTNPFDQRRFDVDQHSCCTFGIIHTCDRKSIPRHIV